MEENTIQEDARRELAKEYPPRTLILDPVAIWGFFTVWSIVGWFLTGLLIFLRFGSGERIPLLWILSFVACIALTVVFGTLTARSARRQRKVHTHNE